MAKKSVTKRTVIGAGVLLLVALPALLWAATAGGGGARSPWQLAFILKGQDKSIAMPMALYIDGERERYYVVASGDNRLVSFDRDGNYLRDFTADGNLHRPHHMARLADGTLLVVERGRNSLTKIDLQRRTTEPVVLSHQGQEIFADRLEFAGGELYLLDRASGRVLRLDQQLQVVGTYELPPGVGNLVDFTVVDNRVWLLDQQNRQIITVGADGSSRHPWSVAEVSFPVSLAVDQSGTVYVLDRHRGSVVVYGRNGEYLYRFLSKGHGRQHLYFPRELRFDPWGRLCVVDQGNSRVLVFRR